MPSRPPLQSEIQQSTSGIIRDPQSGDRVVAASKRPDGTVRKELRIRPGFTPQEDVSRFRSVRQQESNARSLPKGSVVGFIRPEEAAAQVALQNMTLAQRKNAKRKAKRKDIDHPLQEGVVEDADTPDDWDAEDGDTPETSQPGVSSPLSVDVSETPMTEMKKSPPKAGNRLFQNAMKSSSKTESMSANVVVSPAPELPSTTTSHTDTEKRVPPSDPQGAAAQLFGNALCDISGDSGALDKRARALRKKIVQAEILTGRLAKGEILLPEQAEKADQLESLRLELKTLQVA